MGGPNKAKVDAEPATTEEADADIKSNGLRGLFTYATKLDYLASVFSAVILGGLGVAMVSFIFVLKPFFSSAADAETANGGLPMNVVNQMALSFIIIGAAQFAAALPGFGLTNVSAARQKRAWQKAVVKSILRQNVGWYDTSNPEELASKVGSQVALVHKGLEGPSYGIFIAMGASITGIVGGFTEDWAITLVVLSMAPIIALAVAALATVMMGSTKRQNKAYAKAGGIATECLFAMRTVASLGLEKTFGERYASSLTAAKAVKIKSSAKLGVATGVLFSSFLLLQATGFMYGGFIFSNELARSGYEYRVNKTFDFCMPNPAGASLSPICSSVQSELFFCAHANNTPANVSINKPCEAPYQPLIMNCQMARLLESFSGGPGSGNGAGTGGGQQNGEGGGTGGGGDGAFGSGFSMLELIGQDSWEDLRLHARANAPPEYIDENPNYWGCGIEGAVIVLTVMFAMQGSMGIFQAVQPLQALSAAIPAADSLLTICSRVSEIDSFSESGATPASVKGDIEVRDVVFAYPSAPDHLVCNGYSLAVAAGQTVALSGASGSGKSTIIQLLERFYDPKAGSIMLDGVDIKTLNVRWLRNQLGLVSQEPVLFMGTVADNIRYGKRDATQEEIEDAARNANALAFITNSLAKGFDTPVGQGGGKLSGGQKQRVAIARALVKKPAVLLLDEATSALDNESERIVQAALDEIMAKLKRTTIVIAHRLSTIRNADKIAVVDKGTVVEEGTFDELLAKRGTFYTLAQKQEEMGAKDLKTMDAARAEAGSSGHAREAVQAEVVPAKSPRSKFGRASKERAGRSSKEKMGKEADIEVKVQAKEEKAPFGRLLGMQKESYLLLAVGMVFACGSGGLPLYGFYNMLNLFTVYFQLSAELIREETIFYSAILGSTVGGIIICFAGDTGCFGIAAARLTFKLRQQGFKAFVGQDMSFFDSEEHSAGALTAFLAEKVTLIEFLTGGTLQFLLRALSCAGCIILFSAVFGSWQVTLYVAAAFPVMGIAIGAVTMVVAGDDIRAKQGKEGKSEKALKEKEAGAMIGEVVLAIRTVASFNAEHEFVALYEKSVDRIAHLEGRAGFLASISLGLSLAGMMWVMCGLNYYGGWLLNVGACTFQEMMTPMMMMMGGMMIMVGSGLGIKDVPTAKQAAKLFFESTDRKPKIDSFSESGATPASVKGDIEVRDVVFAYPSAPDHLVCNGYSLAVAAGQTVALSGASGSGKSTIIQLLERFYDPKAGSIMLDGVDIKTLNVRWLRNQLGLVSQEPVLFMGTVADNIRYGKRDATQEEIEDAARNANAYDFVTHDLAEGFSTDVGMRGGKLSGGQKQRVAIARALVKKPAVLLLDEATSALDNESERIVQAALDEIMAKLKRTTIVIAHRLSTIRNADKIVVLHEGTVAEQGTHDELLANPEGLYFNLVLAQQ